MTRARCAFEVQAGVIPGTPIDCYTKRFIVTSDQFEADPQSMLDARDEAYDYAKELTNPSALNWVRVDWVYF